MPKYVPYPRGRFWRLGGPLTSEHEAEALATEREHKPGPVGRLVLRILRGSGTLGSRRR